MKILFYMIFPYEAFIGYQCILKIENIFISHLMSVGSVTLDPGVVGQGYVRDFDRTCQWGAALSSVLIRTVASATKSRFCNISMCST